MDSQWKRFWETGLLPSLEFSLSLSIGYVLSLFFYVAGSELALIDRTDTAYPVLQILLVISFSAGFIYRKYKQALPASIAITLLVAAIIQIFWFLKANSPEFLIDYIFSFEFVLLSGILSAFAVGIYGGSLRDFRFLSFALGVTAFTFYSLFEPNQNYSMKVLLGVLYIFLSLYFISSFVQRNPYSSKFYKIRSKIGKHPLFAPFYRSALSLLISYCILHIYFQPGPKIPLILSISFSVIFGRVLSLLGGLKKETKAVFLIGRVALLFAFFFFIYQTYWSSFFIALCIITGSIVGFFKPNKTAYKEYLYIGLETSIYLGLSFLLYFWNLPTGIRTILTLLFVPVLMYPYLMQKHIIRTPRLLMFAIATLIVLIFFSPPTIRTNSPFSKKEIFDPIPFAITNIAFNEVDFIFYKSVLPFKSNPFLPKRSEIKGKTVVLGLSSNQSQIISYIERLSQEQHPFMILTTRNKSNQFHHINALSLLNRKSYWNFDIYYPSYMESKIEFASTIPSDWKLKYFNEKLDNSSTPEVVIALDSVLKYSSGDLRKDAIEIKHLYYESFAEYARFYHNIKQNKLALDAITMARKFEPPKPDLLRIAFNSLKFTTPEAEYIPILEDLSSDPEFQEFAWNSLIPMFESLRDWNRALTTMSALEKFYRSRNRIEQANELELARVRLFINQENWKEVEPLIAARIRENPDSVIWERLKNEVIEKKDSLRRLSVRPDVREARIQ
ncbi:hypothetical protein ND861_18260 [Leptospira sp. 2 VSF19]|uniref:Uncharacterized protein n=1 Tax=Leptospira soteropolitanensis TaxID=2950025 RepID=A0AAW5VTT4_9LEPT|nr:hypothetical protein [Leptospira soteropolitanensis]MCW7494535.1 hypothetical protein [Leptospira soteropolitanensis]MCW7502129.1 hypothetical protein [Leptospira soteropolitanensis]MCW7524441.1 hypothetical protein [Leptospira soteropolitanensis]MCW7528307.1 hypothetical protein [Leptospira soteropolitanensis]MCW7532099.1 hypothetical protein [Leptospira soteropolitanensis]